ncbi:MAG: FAD-dependent oxidoreductase [Armatimonadia bacterium]|nr:FAD-dependent oxidoreductase [Armatimonadia bacterium]
MKNLNRATSRNIERHAHTGAVARKQVSCHSAANRPSHDTRDRRKPSMGITERNFDVIVAGGGISGSMAAIAAAREGASTLLVERYAALGGMATLGLVQPITTWGLGGSYVVAGTGKRMLEEMIQQRPGSATEMNHYGPSCDAEHLKRLLEETALQHGVELLYHSWITGVESEGERITGLRTVSKSGEALLRGDVFVDATGDGDVAAFAGIPADVGSQGITLMFHVTGIDRERCPDRTEIAKMYADAGAVNYRMLAMFWAPQPGSAYMNVTEVEDHDALDVEDLTAATIECRRQAWAIIDILRAEVPGFEDAWITQTAPALGVRESRHVRGLHTLSGDDVEAGRDFEDTIARASCPVDIHGSQNEGKGTYHGLKRSYGVPWRSLVTPEYANLLLTGRCLSADTVAHSSVRRMGPGFALGEAAGIGAAQTLAHGDVRDMPIAPLQDRLREFGAILDPED